MHVDNPLTLCSAEILVYPNLYKSGNTGVLAAYMSPLVLLFFGSCSSEKASISSPSSNRSMRDNERESRLSYLQTRLSLPDSCKPQHQIRTEIHKAHHDTHTHISPPATAAPSTPGAARRAHGRAGRACIVGGGLRKKTRVFLKRPLGIGVTLFLKLVPGAWCLVPVVPMH